MDQLAVTKSALIARARKRSDQVLPCGSRQTLEDCFTTLPTGELAFHWNDASGNTHMQRASELVR